MRLGQFYEILQVRLLKSNVPLEWNSLGKEFDMKKICKIGEIFLYFLGLRHLITSTKFHFCKINDK